MSSMWIIGGIAALVLAGEPLVRMLWANRARLAALQSPSRRNLRHAADGSALDPNDAERREKAFRAIEEVVAYFENLGDTEGAEEARAAGRLLFGKPSVPTNRKG